MEDKVKESNMFNWSSRGKVESGVERCISVTNVTKEPQTYQFKISHFISLIIFWVLNLQGLS